MEKKHFSIINYRKGQYAFYPVKLSRFAEKNVAPPLDMFKKARVDRVKTWKMMKTIITIESCC